jgi:two-component system, sensor histidine kinase and response regulator
MRVLVCDDDKQCAEFMAAFVAAAGHEVVGIETAGGLSVLQGFQRHRPDCVVLDVRMPRLNGFTVAQHLRSKAPQAKIIFMSGFVPEDFPSARQCSADGWLTKPVAFDQLRDALSRAAESLVAA